MLRRVLVFLLCFLLLFPAWAWADDYFNLLNKAGSVPYGVTFGLTQARNRDGMVIGSRAIQWYGWSNKGTSYSQPILTSAGYFGLPDHPDVPGLSACAITVEKDYLYGYWLGKEDFVLDFDPDRVYSIWSLPLSSETKSHPTLVEWNGRKYVFIGTVTGAEGKPHLDIFDVTDFLHPKAVRRVILEDASDIVSAPAVFRWHDFLMVVYTTGNTGKVHVLALEDPEKASPRDAQFYISLGSGRTSSSPAPVLNGQGFAVGLDQGPSDGKLYVIRFEDRFEIKNGQIVPKPKDERKFYAVEDLPSGLCASFATDQGGATIYFGDSRSHYYAYSVTGRYFIWRQMNAPTAGMFCNRSPALTPTRVYFPAGTKPGTKGALVALDRETGRVVWTHLFQSTAQSAPVIMRATDEPLILEGTATLTGKEGWLALLDPVSGEIIEGASVEAGGSSSYAGGLSGELSFIGSWGVASDFNGATFWSIVPYLDFEAVSIDPGVPEGEEAKAGQWYTATVKFGSDFGAHYAKILKVGVDADVNGNPAVLADVYGNKLPEATVNGKTFYYVGPVEAGKGEYTVKFKWQAQPSSDGYAHLRAWINLNELNGEPLGRIGKTWAEDNDTDDPYANNLVSAKVKVAAYDVSVKVSFPKSVYYIPYDRETTSPTASVIVSRPADAPKDIQVKLTISGPAGAKVQTLTLDTAKWLQYQFTVGPGTYTVTARVEPLNFADPNPANNVSSASAQVKKQASPQTGPKEPGLHVEIGGGGGK